VLVAQQLRDHLLGPAEHVVGSGGDVEVGAPLGEHGAGEVGEPRGGVAGTDVDPRHHPRTGVEGEQCRGAAAGRDAAAVRRHQAEPHQHIDPRGDRRTGQSGGVGELRPRAGLPVTQQLEDVAGPHGRK
jgi:hypothetical protein